MLRWGSRVQRVRARSVRPGCLPAIGADCCSGSLLFRDAMAWRQRQDSDPPALPRFVVASLLAESLPLARFRIGCCDSFCPLAPVLASSDARQLFVFGSSGLGSLYRGLAGLVMSRFWVAHRKRKHVVFLTQKYYYLGHNRPKRREVKREKSPRQQLISEMVPRGRSLVFRTNERAQRVPEWKRGPLGASGITGVRRHAVRRRARPRSAGRRDTPTRWFSARIAPGRSFGGLRIERLLILYDPVQFC